MGLAIRNEVVTRRYRPQTARRCVLLAEDDPELRLLLGLALRRDGHEVVEARDGRQLLETLGAELSGDVSLGLDLVITDLQMPGCSGIQAMAAVRALRRPMPVILITAYVDDAVRSKAAREGVAAVFGKPFELDDLRTAMLNVTVPRWPRSGPRAVAPG
jgi:two-component system response regulator (stage 0 sporulation protein F)